MENDTQTTIEQPPISSELLFEYCLKNFDLILRHAEMEEIISLCQKISEARIKWKILIGK